MCICYGKVTVLGDDGNPIQINKTDERYLSGELHGVNVGKVVVRDSNGKTMRISKDDPRYLSGELRHMAANIPWSDERRANWIKRMWIYNDELKTSIQIPVTEKIPNGWIKGRRIFK
jgi:hypothetical protein